MNSPTSFDTITKTAMNKINSKDKLDQILYFILDQVTFSVYF